MTSPRGGEGRKRFITKEMRKPLLKEKGKVSLRLRGFFFLWPGKEEGDAI